MLNFRDKQHDSELMEVADRVHLAHEAYYNAKGQYVAFSEGNGFSSQYLWEWVVGPEYYTGWEIITSGGAVYTGNAIVNQNSVQFPSTIQYDIRSKHNRLP